jgi:predicted GNAT family acetyltransferase
MVWEAPPPVEDAAPDAVLLEPAFRPGSRSEAHESQAVRSTHAQLGEYFGYFEGGQLIAMAGERMCAGNLHEVSGICTHPTFQGRGLARKLTLKLVRRQLNRGKTPFLHVLSHNTAARALYEKMGFRIFRETRVRVALRVL